MKLPPLLLGATFLALASLAAAPAGRERIRFDDDWKFHLRDASVGDPPPAAGSPGMPLESWRWTPSANPAAETADTVRADFDDHAWNTTRDAKSVITRENSFAWFRTPLPASAGRGSSLHFESVDDNATVYLNGQFLARHGGWDESFDVPLASAWRDGGPNVVAVLVENVGGAGGIAAASLTTTAADPSPAPTGPMAADYDDAAWRGVHLPHDFVVEGAFDPQEEASHGFLPRGAGWYRKTFSLPADDKGKTLWLEFDGVYRNSVVWLNGQPLGQHASGYTSFYYDVSAAANYGGKNVLAVWADARKDEGWWYEGGGIYRHVWLTKLAPLHVAHWGIQVDTTPDTDFRHANVKVSVTLANDGPEPKGALRNEILGPDGKSVLDSLDHPVEVAQGERTVNAGGFLIRTNYPLAAPQLWSPDSPALYTLRTTLSQDGKVVDQVDTPFGVRSLRWDADKGFFLNGKPFKIQGTCNHQDFAGVGVALPDHLQEYKVQLLKEMGSNAFRFSHQPMAPELLDACDRLGMVVMDENRKLGDSAEILGQVESLVRRDRNHPCVILWSMCNEESTQGTPRAAEQFKAMEAVVRKWDRTRPITCAMHHSFGSGISLVEDLQGFNYHPGDYDGFHQQFPRQPGYGSETASEKTTRGIYADDPDKGYVGVYQRVHESAWKPLAESDWLAGGFVWTGFDYRGEPSPYKWPCVNSHFGIMDTCGFPKDSYYYYLGQWGREPVAHLLPHWNWPGREGQEVEVWVHGNAAKYDLLLNGVSLGAKEMPRHSHIEWTVRYTPGVLETRGYDAAGKQIVADRVETTGAPARLQLVPDRARFRPDGEDVAVVRCAVLDAQGRVVPTADNAVTFAVNGPASVAGVGNGDPSDHEPDRASARRAFGGRCLAVVQSTGAAGGVTLTAQSPGLADATIELRAGED